MNDILVPAVASEHQPAPGQVVEHRLATLDKIEFRDTTDTNDGTMTLSGHAAVFDRMSLPLYDWQYGEFQERIARGAFENVLNRNPDVHLVVAHDMRLVLARTQSKTLELREDPAGLRVFAKIDPEISFAKDLRIQMKRGDVDQMSFAFTVASDQWLIEDPDTPNMRVVRTIQEVGDLYDVSVVAQGAYAQTDAQLRGLLEHAADDGRVAYRSRSLPRLTRGADLSQPDPEDAGETLATDLAEAIEALSDLIADGYDLSMPADPDAGTTVADEVTGCIGYLSDVLGQPDQTGAASAEPVPSRSAAKAVGDDRVDCRSDTKSEGGLDLRQHRTNQMRQALIKISKKEQDGA